MFHLDHREIERISNKNWNKKKKNFPHQLLCRILRGSLLVKAIIGTIMPQTKLSNHRL